MAITNGYCTLDELKSRLDIASNQQDANLEQMIEAASRQIDGWTARTFYVETATRTVTAEWPDMVALDRDLLSVTSLTTDDGSGTFGTTWAPTDYDFDESPYQSIHVTSWGQQSFPVRRRGVRITGTWGYASEVPHAIREACLLMAARLYKRKDAPFGIAGTADHGQVQTISSIDPDVKQLIQPFRRFGLVGV